MSSGSAGNQSGDNMGDAFSRIRSKASASSCLQRSGASPADTPPTKRARLATPVPIYNIYVYQMYHIDASTGTRYLIALDFGGAYPIKSMIANTPSAIPAVFWTFQRRLNAFDEAQLEQKPDHYMKSQPYWVVNGVSEVVEDLQTVSDNLNQYVEAIITQCDGTEVDVQGVTKRLSFHRTSVQVGPVLRDGPV